MKINIPVEGILAVAPFICKEETRYYLNGIHVAKQPDDTFALVATNGHQMGVWHDPDSQKVSELPPNIIFEVSDHMRAFMNQERDVEECGYRVAVLDLEAKTLQCDNLVQQGVIIQATYPDWRKVIPNVETLEPYPFGQCGFDTEFMGAYDHLSHPRAAMRLFSGGSPEYPTLVFVDTAPNFLGVLMPRRLINDRDLLADFRRVSGKPAPQKVEEAKELEAETVTP